MNRKKVLVVAFYFPPSSGAAVQRTLKAVEYFEERGWDPIILTATENAYDAVEYSQTIPANVSPECLYRAPAWDVFETFSYKGKHFSWMTTIDRWSTWIPGAILKGRKIIEQHQPDLIWSTTPIPSANIIARYLSKKSGLPWIADYQDPLSCHNPPMLPLKRKVWKWIDKITLENCDAAMFATDRASQAYQDTFVKEPAHKFNTIENGFDETNWQKLESHQSGTKSPISEGKFTLFYSGVLYSNGRDPKPLFQALATLREKGKISDSNFELIFQGAGEGQEFDEYITQLGIRNLVKFTASVPYLDSLNCMREAQALVLIQDAIFNMQVPGKLYEYMRSNKPVIVVSPEGSATRQVASQHELCKIALSANQIADAIESCIVGPNEESDVESLQRFSRRQRSSEIVDVFNAVLDRVNR